MPSGQHLRASRIPTRTGITCHRRHAGRPERECSPNMAGVPRCNESALLPELAAAAKGSQIDGVARLRGTAMVGWPFDLEEIDRLHVAHVAYDLNGALGNEIGDEQGI